jgi:hypothetical protein
MVAVVVAVIIYTTATSGVKEVGPITFKTTSDTVKPAQPTQPVNHNDGIQIENMEGDVITNGSTKNVYFSPDTSKSTAK